MEMLNFSAALKRIEELLGSDQFNVDYNSSRILLKNDPTKILISFRDVDWVFCRVLQCIVPSNKFDYNTREFI